MRRFFKLITVSCVLILTACGGKNNETSSPPPAPAQNMDSTNVDTTYDKESIVNAASDFFGEGSEAVASVIEKAFADLGRPNGYIIGTEASAALVVGAR
ncbi:MAG TPA: EipA family protein, partial [Emcibacteraceae bacterium]|nr:EipA family protein [Emcibacteraceae bacterium]